jgi:hypothetical protein
MTLRWADGVAGKGRQTTDTDFLWEVAKFGDRQYGRILLK